jgi:hypothetical protein
MTAINPNTFFDIDAACDEAQKNVYAELEHTLNLPIGSTQDAIAASKDLISKTKALAVQADMLEFQENSIDNRDAEEINDDVLRQDRARIRKEAHELYDMGKNMLTYMYNQVKSQIDPNDKMWAAVANMISSVSKSLADLNKMTKEFREENDRDIEKKIQSGELDVNEQEFDFSPEQANKIIASWTKQNEANILDQIKTEVEEREMARIGVETKQIENKGEL